MEYGMITVASAIPGVTVADCQSNLEEIKNIVLDAERQHVEILVFPELSLTGYSCQDLFSQSLLLNEAERALVALLQFTTDKDIIIIVGAPIRLNTCLLNAAVVIQQGKILGVIPKTFLPNYSEFYEQRWFTSMSDVSEMPLHIAGQDILISSKPTIFTTSSGVRFGIELCEDLWTPIPPSSALALLGAELIFNLSASNELTGKHEYLCSLLSQQSARCLCGYIYSSCGFGESTQDVVYSGNAFVYENGTCLAKSERYSITPQLVIAQIDVERLRNERKRNTSFAASASLVLTENVFVSTLPPRKEFQFILRRTFNPLPFVPSSEEESKVCEEIINIQVLGLAKRLKHTHSKQVVLGISGGLDSTLALLVCVKTFDKLGLDRRGIIGVTMPGFGTTDRTYNNAVGLMRCLGITIEEINISESVLCHFKAIKHDPAVHDVTYENSQARERTQILMDLSNQLGGLVIGTGDLSELALGWATYNGDHMSMYAVNASIPKTLVRTLVKHASLSFGADTKAFLIDILDTPISPELIPADSSGKIRQITEDIVGPYELHDFFLYHFLRFGFSPKKIFMMACAAFNDHEREIRYDEVTIKKWLIIFLNRFFSQQFKRSCMPDGVKVGSVCLSPRGDWRMPSDACAQLWIEEAKAL